MKSPTVTISDSFLDVLSKRTFERIQAEPKLKGHDVYALEEAMRITIRTLKGMCNEANANKSAVSRIH